MPRKFSCQLVSALILSGAFPLAVFAQTSSTLPQDNITPVAANVGGGMSERLMCQTAYLFQSQFGLLIGLAMGIAGLWFIIRYGKIKPALFLIIGGALISALPSLILSFFSGTNGFLKNTGLSTMDFTSAMMDPLSHTSNCDAITIDTTPYDEAASASPQAAAVANMGGANPVAAQAAQHTYGSGSAARMDPNAVQGTAGCASLVPGGVPTSPFSPARLDPTGSGITRPHTGTDIGCRAGVTGSASPIKAAAAGTVIQLVTGYGGGYGNHIAVSVPGVGINTYNHMRSLNVSGGQSVNAGDIVGYCGTTGHSTGPHLHFELKQNGVFVDPVKAGCQ